MDLTRGQLLRSGAAGSLLLALGGCASLGGRPQEENDAMLAAVAGVMLSGVLPEQGEARTRALARAVQGVHVAIGGLGPDARAQLRQLFGLLAFAPARWLLAGVTHSWSSASPAEVGAFLHRWRFGGSMLLRSGYQALHQLVMAGWYGDATAWPATGYPGPPRIA
jgi:hypothetical protein